MSRSGVVDPLYVAARRALLDALEAVENHLDALVLVGAQAIYLHTGEGDLAVAPYTTDGDLALDPSRLGPAPLLEEALAESGFTRKPTVVGIWHTNLDVAGTHRPVAVDFLVPASLAGEGRRGARIPPHSKTAARKVVGLEGALVDRDVQEISSMEEDDHRTFTLNVAGPGALLVAKLHKIDERLDDMNRLSDKDALDVLRLLQSIPTKELARRIGLLIEDPMARAVTASAMECLPRLFGDVGGPGSQMAARAASPLEDPDTVGASLAALTEALLHELERIRRG